MKKKFAVLTRVLALCMVLGCTLTPVSASVIISEREEIVTTFSNRVSMKVGEEMDVSRYIQHRRSGKGDDAHEAYWTVRGLTSWSSASPEVATVSSKGVITAKRVGVARITATFSDDLGREHQQKITVSVGANSSQKAVLKADPSASFTVDEGKSIDLSALFFPTLSASQKKTVQWESSNKSIASVKSSGKVAAIDIGNCTISAVYTDADGNQVAKKATVRVSSNLVSDRPKAISFTISAGDSVDLAQLLYPGYTDNPVIVADMKVKASNADLVSVSGTTITGKAKGTTNVTITTGEAFDNEKKQTVSVKVTD